jgi:hypothetical protein
MSLTCKSWDLKVIRGLEQASPTKVIFLFITETKAHWRTILTCCLKNWMQKKKKKKKHFNHKSWKRWKCYLVKWSITHSGAPCTSMAIGIKMCPSWSHLYLWILVMMLSFVAAPVGQLMTLVTTVFHVGLITTTLATKIWFSQIM